MDAPELQPEVDPIMADFRAKIAACEWALVRIQAMLDQAEAEYLESQQDATDSPEAG
jgi:hypothetical protein